MVQLEDEQRLHPMVRDLVAISALSAVWASSKVPRIAEDLAEVLLSTLKLHFVYVRLDGEAGKSHLEVVRVAQPLEGTDPEKVIPGALAPWLKAGTEEFPSSIPDPQGQGLVHLVAMPLGFSRKFGILVAASRKVDFPSQDDRLLLGVAVNQASTMLKCRRTQVRLREKEEQFHALADHIAQLAWMADSTGWIFWYNRRWFEYTGTTLEQMQGWGWWKVHHPDHVDRVVEKIRRCFQSGEAWEDTFPLRGRDGSYRWFLSRAFPIRDKPGKVVRWFGTNTDITEQRQAEEALRQADRRKDYFLAILAHELRNPLAPIRNSVQVLRRLGPPDPERQWAWDVIERQVRQMTRLIDDLLDLSRISRGKIVLHKEIVNLAAVVTRAVETTRPLLEERQHELTVSLPPEPVWLEADPARLEQILCNLLTNAAKYTEPGGKIWLTAEQDQKTVVIGVRDTGIGMTPEALANAFSMFVQAEEGKEHACGGLGIGLSLVRSLVKMHGGSVSAHSLGPNQGSEFTVRLPVLEGHHAARKVLVHATKQHASQVSGCRILLVEDDQDAAQSLAMLLRLMGNDVHVSFDGPSALEAASAYKPDVVLVDIGLPGMSGHEVARRLRQQPGLEEVVLVAVTGWGQEEDRRLSKEAGFDFHLVKPIEIDVLQELLASVKPSAKKLTPSQ